MTFLVLFAVQGWGDKVKSNKILINHAVTSAVLLCFLLCLCELVLYCLFITCNCAVASSLVLLEKFSPELKLQMDPVFLDIVNI